MRIAIVGTELCAVDPRGGGLEQVLRRWAMVLAERHEVSVVSHGRPAASADPYSTIVLERTSDLRPTLAGLAPDVVCLNNRPQWVSLCPPAAAIGVVFHNYPAAWKLGPAARNDLRRPGGRAASLGAVSRALASAAAVELGAPVESVVVLPPSIDPAYLAVPDRRPEPIVLAPNRLLAKKGVRDLLDVAARAEFRGVTFSFADLISPWRRPTAEHRSLRAAVGRVGNARLFAPAAAPEELAHRYATSGVVACPVREPEGLGLVALEAQACGAPLVTTDLGGLREATFAPNACVPAGDLDALAAALLAALDQRGVDASGPRQHVIARHSPTASGAAFEAWLTAVVSGGGPRR